ncbi:MFS transporter [Yinghuangia soli]|uniref:MFS transporter n=1 Tax=Yinghuangia soli TaxID=2908204 RepID=A0AA41U2P6_9ACTN|nr:MFS transporter [Yinghuangia soli]MCF2530910.1 MFS transporter [Yinghuangia soli]
MSAPDRSAARSGSDPVRSAVYAVAACHFVASFAALGLPPYLVEILPTLGDEEARWAGVLYVVPTVCGALAAPVWGRLGDRFGRKRLLLRAQLGLAVAFLLTGLAQSLPAFTAALVLQGLLGGTFAASTGYLAGVLPTGRLAWALTLMQGSARAALVAAPVVVGLLAPVLPPHRQYLVMALLPLTAAVTLALLPAPGADPAETAKASSPAGSPDSAGSADAADTTDTAAAAGSTDSCEAPNPQELPLSGVESDNAPAKHLLFAPRLRVLLALEFVFVFATIVTFPYLTALVEDRMPGLPSVTSGVVFALPHVCYLVLARPALAVATERPAQAIAAGFGLVAAGCVLHLPDAGLPLLLAARVVFGAGLTAGLVGLSALTAQMSRGRAPGSLFGTLEFVSKLGAVAAGLAASALTAHLGPDAPQAAGALLGAAAALTLVPRLRRRPANPANPANPAKEPHAPRRSLRRTSRRDRAHTGHAADR